MLSDQSGKLLAKEKQGLSGGLFAMSGVKRPSLKALFFSESLSM